MRRAAKVDTNQAAIVAALRQAGYGVQSLAAVGGGCPDLLVAAGTRNVLLEVKRPKRGVFTSDQLRWWAAWPGELHVVRTPDEAAQAMRRRKCR